MEPERVRAYLQAACAGLGFEIGEVWWTSNEQGSSTVAAIGTYEPPWSTSVEKREEKRVFGLNQCFSMSDVYLFRCDWLKSVFVISEMVMKRDS